jgi:hypothetical protein
MSAHTRCDECRAEHTHQKLRLHSSGGPAIELCSWACLAALAAKQGPIEAANRAMWDAKVDASLKAQALSAVTGRP